MQIVGGRHRGRLLKAPAGLEVRPTSSLTRESLFNILAHGRLAKEGSPLAEATVLDAFAGSGANGLEALSRGAAHAIFMETQGVALAALRQNVRTLREEANATILQCDVLHPPRATQACSLALLDPPYGQGLAAPALTALRAAGWLAPDALVTVEVMKKEPFKAPEGFETLDERTYGKARVAFLRLAGA